MFLIIFAPLATPILIQACALNIGSFVPVVDRKYIGVMKMNDYETTYRGKHIVKHKKENGITVETYVEFEEGQVYLNTYVNFKLYSRIRAADLRDNSKGSVDAANLRKGDL